MSHQSVQEFIQSGRPLDEGDRVGIEMHLANCAECRDFAAFHRELSTQVPQVYPSVRHSDQHIRQRVQAARATLEKRQKVSRIFQNVSSIAWAGAILGLVLILGILVPHLVPARWIGLAPTQTRTALTAPTASATPAPTLTATPAAVSLPNEQVLSQAVLHSEAQAYCSWQVLGYDPEKVYAWVLCELQKAPFTAVSVPVVITTGNQGRYMQVTVPQDGSLYLQDVQKLFPEDIRNLQSIVLGRQVDLQKLEWGIAQRKAGSIASAYVIPTFGGNQDCQAKKLTQNNLPVAIGATMGDWKTYTQSEDGFALDVPVGWQVVEHRLVCPNGQDEPHYLELDTPDSAYQLVFSFRLPDQDSYITRSGTPAGEFVSGGTVNFLGTGLSIDRLIYQNQGKEQVTSVMYAGGMEFLANRMIFTIGLDVTTNPNLSIPQDVQDQAIKILASARSLAPESSTPSPVLSPTPVTSLAVQAQTGGAVSGVALLGDLAFVGSGPRLAAIDISNPASPQLSAQSPVLPGAVSGVLVLSPYPPRELVVSAGRYIVTLAWSEAGQFSVIGMATLPGEVKAMVLDTTHHLLYAAGSIYQSYDTNSGDVSTGYIAVVGLDPSGAPQYYGQQTGLAANVSGLALGGETLYIGLYTNQGYKGISAIELKDQTEFGQPVIVIAPDANGTMPLDMAVSGSRLYVSYQGGMAAYDISTPDAPQPVWQVTEDGSGKPLMAIWGFVLYRQHIDLAGVASAGGYIPWQASFTPPNPVDSNPENVVASTVVGTSNLLLVARDGLEIYDNSDPQNLKPLGAYHPYRAYVVDQVSAGNYVYVIEESNQGWADQYLNVLRASDLAVAGVYRFELPDHSALWDWYRGMALDGNRLVVFGRFGAWIFDVSSPTHPSLIGQPPEITYALDGGAAQTVAGRSLVAAFTTLGANGSNRLEIYDVTDPKHAGALETGISFAGQQLVRLVWDGSQLYALTTTVSGAEPEDWLTILSFANDTLAVQSRTKLTRVTTGLAVQDDLVAVAGSSGLTVLSAVDPTRPVILSQTPLPGSRAAVAFKGRQLLVAAVAGGSGQLITYDLSDVAQKGVVTENTVDIPASSQFGVLTVSAETVFYSSYASGLEAFK